MDGGHVKRPQKIAVTLNAFTRIPDKPVTIREIVRVSHRDHRIIAQPPVAFSSDDGTMAEYHRGSPEQK